MTVEHEVLAGANFVGGEAPQHHEVELRVPEGNGRLEFVRHRQEVDLEGLGGQEVLGCEILKTDKIGFERSK